MWNKDMIQQTPYSSVAEEEFAEKTFVKMYNSASDDVNNLSDVDRLSFEREWRALAVSWRLPRIVKKIDKRIKLLEHSVSEPPDAKQAFMDYTVAINPAIKKLNTAIQEMERHPQEDNAEFVGGMSYDVCKMLEPYRTSKYPKIAKDANRLYCQLMKVK